MRVNMNKTKAMISGNGVGNAEGCKMTMWCLW